MGAVLNLRPDLFKGGARTLCSPVWPAPGGRHQPRVSLLARSPALHAPAELREDMRAWRHMTRLHMAPCPLPCRCAGAILGVPFVDCLTTMLDETIPLTGVDSRRRAVHARPRWQHLLCAMVGSRARAEAAPCTEHRLAATPPRSPRAAVIEWEEWGNPAEKQYYECGQGLLRRRQGTR